jgi:hypothetical protein
LGIKIFSSLFFYKKKFKIQFFFVSLQDILLLMKKIILGFLVWFIAVSPMFAQRTEIGGFAGGAFYLGDLNPAGLFSQTQPAFGAVYRYNLTTRWAIRGNIFWGTVTADDAKYDNPRNLNFRSRISEFSVQAELNFLPYFTGSIRNHRFSPYLFGGVGVFSFNPEADYYDPVAGVRRWVPLAPLGTEGQGHSAFPDKKPYSTVQISLPFGLGFKYSLNSTFSIGIEWGMRKTFTDYLDDVSGVYVDHNILSATDPLAARLSDRSVVRNPVGSDRGSSNRTDWYSFAGITLTAKISRFRQESCPAHRISSVERIKNSMRP